MLVVSRQSALKHCCKAKFTFANALTQTGLRMKDWGSAIIVALLSVWPASAKVEKSDAAGFVLVYEDDVAVPPDVAFARFLEIGKWWSSDHSYSGDASNMKISSGPGGCWCETVPGGGHVQHMQVVNVQPGSLLVLSGGLGPLQFLGVSGSMTISFAPKEAGTHVSLRYVVGGYDPDKFAKWPAAVDLVLGAGFESYLAFAAK